MQKFATRRERKAAYGLRHAARVPQLGTVLLRIVTEPGEAERRGLSREDRIEAARLLVGRLYRPGPQRERELEKMINTYIS